MEKNSNNPIILNNHEGKDILHFLKGNDNIGVELGVAEGYFSKTLIQSGKFKKIIGVDLYNEKSFNLDSHDINQYKRAIRNTNLFSENYKILRMSFEEALDLFEDNFLDFIYFDGYAHSGQMGGKTIFDWVKKIKIGGVIAGDDYHKDWPLNIASVDFFIKKSGFKLYITKKPIDLSNSYSEYPSWLAVKKNDINLNHSKELFLKGQKENQRIRMKKIFSIIRVKYIYKLLPYKLVITIKKIFNKI